LPACADLYAVEGTDAASVETVGGKAVYKLPSSARLIPRRGDAVHAEAARDLDPVKRSGGIDVEEDEAGRGAANVCPVAVWILRAPYLNLFRRCSGVLILGPGN